MVLFSCRTDRLYRSLEGLSPKSSLNSVEYGIILWLDKSVSAWICTRVESTLDSPANQVVAKQLPFGRFNHNQLKASGRLSVYAPCLLYQRTVESLSIPCWMIFLQQTIRSEIDKDHNDILESSAPSHRHGWLYASPSGDSLSVTMPMEIISQETLSLLAGPMGIVSFFTGKILSKR